MKKSSFTHRQGQADGALASEMMIQNPISQIKDNSCIASNHSQLSPKLSLAWMTLAHGSIGVTVSITDKPGERS